MYFKGTMNYQVQLFHCDGDAPAYGRYFIIQIDEPSGPLHLKQVELYSGQYIGYEYFVSQYHWHYELYM